MGTFWIRHRGKTTGPYSSQRIQSLLRRGRLGRHCLASRNKQTWLGVNELLAETDECPDRAEQNQSTALQVRQSPFDAPVRDAAAQHASPQPKRHEASPLLDVDDPIPVWQRNQGIFTPAIIWARCHFHRVAGIILLLSLATAGIYHFQSGELDVPVENITRIIEKIPGEIDSLFPTDQEETVSEAGKESSTASGGLMQDLRDRLQEKKLQSNELISAESGGPSDHPQQ